MNARRRRRQRGFSLLEVTATLLLFSIMAGSLQLSLTRRQIDRVEQEEFERVADQVHRLAQAAQHFAVRNGGWPNESLRCAQAYRALQAANLLRGAPEKSPYRDADGNRTAYALSCDADHFQIRVAAESAEQAAELARRLPGASTAGSVVTAPYPKPTANPPAPPPPPPPPPIPDNRFMRLDGGSRPTRTWDMGNQYVFGTRDTLTETGQSLANSVQFATTARPGQSIRKPRCPGGMRPYIFTALNRVSAPSGRGLHGVELPVRDTGSAWVVQAFVHTSAGVEAVSSTTTRIAAFVKCSY